MSHNACYALRLSLWTDLQRLASRLEVKWPAKLSKLPRLELRGAPAAPSPPAAGAVGLRGGDGTAGPGLGRLRGKGKAARPRLFLSFLFSTLFFGSLKKKGPFAKRPPRVGGLCLEAAGNAAAP